MRYLSTRSPAYNIEICRTFSDILLEGLAPDGGLYMPEYYPEINTLELDSWRHLSYGQMAYEILKKFATDIPAADLKNIVDRTYTAQNYGHTRNGEQSSDIVPIRTLPVFPYSISTTDVHTGTLKLLGLSNGPTLAFKDMAMQLLGNLFEYILEKKQTHINILGATSGDTGSAAEYALRGKKGIRVFMLSPHQKMSAFQSAQMFSLNDPNIFNLAVKGVFDDCQNIVKALSNDLPFKTKHKITTVNSINWARIVAQVIYYFWGYLKATTHSKQKVSFTVPSGNFGNICAGHIARMMKLPIDKLVVATNENSVLNEFFQTGIYQTRTTKEVHHTSSPSMDISKASNFERFIYDLLNRDGARVHYLFQKIDTHGRFDLSGGPGSDGNEFSGVSDYGFQSGVSTHTDRIQTIKNMYRQCNLIIDPHTADGIKVALEHLQPDIPMIVLETAQPAKFNETILEALGISAPRPSHFEKIETQLQYYQVIENQSETVKQFILQHVSP